MSDKTWNAERIAEMRRVLTEEPFMFAAGAAVAGMPSLLDALESARAERDTEVSRLLDGCAALQEHVYWLERYLRDPHGSVRCEDRAAFDPPCGGCEGCLTAQAVYGVTGKAVTS